MKIIPANETIAELEKKAGEHAERAERESGSIAAGLREEVELFRWWIAALKSGKWTS